MNFPDLLDHSCFKAFWFAARTLNFSRAATEAAMTQSGVSQHIQKLEKTLGKALFRRTSKVVELTAEGERVLQFIETYLDLDAVLRTDLSGIESSLLGDVRYAMPLSCLMSPHFEQLLSVRQALFPNIQLKVAIHQNHDIADLIALGKMDFGFLTEKIARPDLDHVNFCKEQYVLVAHEHLIRELERGKKVEELAFIIYPGFRAAFDRWLSGNGKRSVNIHKLLVAGEISDLRGVITMLKSGVGATVLAKHCIAHDLIDGLRIAPKTKEVNNQVYLTSKKGVDQVLRVRTVIDAFLRL